MGQRRLLARHAERPAVAARLPRPVEELVEDILEVRGAVDAQVEELLAGAEPEDGFRRLLVIGDREGAVVQPVDVVPVRLALPAVVLRAPAQRQASGGAEVSRGARG